MLTAVVYFFTAFAQGKIRQKVFNAEFMSQFDQEHQEAFGSKAPVGGYPDSGNGYYADKLSYEHWYEFNNWQRAHYNLLETIVPISAMIMITSVNLPFVAMLQAGCFFVGRVFYGFGYCIGGPKGRIPGALITDIALITALVTGFVSVFMWQPSASATKAGELYRIFPIGLQKFKEVYSAQTPAEPASV